MTVAEKRALEEAEELVVPIPKWIKSNAEWWSQGELSEDEFLMAIEYMVKEGIIQINWFFFCAGMNLTTVLIFLQDVSEYIRHF